MAHRARMTNKRKDASVFRNTASPRHTRSINIMPKVSRGGIRL